MIDKNHQRAVDSFRFLLIAAAIIYTGFYLITAMSRIGNNEAYPPAELSSVSKTNMIVEGNPESTPGMQRMQDDRNISLYHYTGAALTYITGNSHFSLRLISFLSSLLIFAFIFGIVKRETVDSLSALISVGFFAACFDLSGGAFDLATGDSFYLSLLISGLYLTYFMKQRIYYIAAGALFAAAYLTNPVSVFVLLILVHYFKHEKVNGAYILISFLIFAGLLLILFPFFRINGIGSFFGIDGAFDWSWMQLAFFWINDMLKPVAVAFLISVVACLVFIFKKEIHKYELIWAFFSFLVVSLMLSMKSLHGNAALMPAYLLMSILFGVGFNRFEKIFFGIKSMSGVHAVLFLYLTATAQFALMTYCPVKFIP